MSSEKFHQTVSEAALTPASPPAIATTVAVSIAYDASDTNLSTDGDHEIPKPSEEDDDVKSKEPGETPAISMLAEASHNISPTSTLAPANSVTTKYTTEKRVAVHSESQSLLSQPPLLASTCGPSDLSTLIKPEGTPPGCHASQSVVYHSAKANTSSAETPSSNPSAIVSTTANGFTSKGEETGTATEKDHILRTAASSENVIKIVTIDTDQAALPPPPRRPKKRARQHTNLLSERYVATKWMVDHATVNGQTNIKSKAVRKFPDIFTGSEKAALQKASRWWKSRQETLALCDPDVRDGAVTTHMRCGHGRSPMKALPGRGRRRAHWVLSLYLALLREYERLHAMDVKISSSLLQKVAHQLASRAPRSSLHCSATVTSDGVSIAKKINARWVEQFLHAHSIVLRWSPRRHNTTTTRCDLLERHVAFHLGTLKRAFENGTFSDEFVESASEMRFSLNLPSGRSIGLESNELHDDDVGEIGEEISVITRIISGQHARVEVPLVIFADPDRSYPLKDFADTLPGACYRTSPAAAFDGQVFLQWLRDSRTMSRSPDGCTKHLFVDGNCGFGEDVEIQVCLRSLNIELHRMPLSVTNFLQPGRCIIIPEMRKMWKRHLDSYVAERDEKNISASAGVPAHQVPKKFYLQLAASVVRELNNVNGNDTVPLARKAMIRTGLSQNINGVWEVSQLSDELREIIVKHRSHFEGEPVQEVLTNTTLGKGSTEV